MTLTFSFSDYGLVDLTPEQMDKFKEDEKGFNQYIQNFNKLYGTNVKTNYDEIFDENGKLIANQYITSQSIVNTASGSNIFGNSPDDLHKFTGSCRMVFPTASGAHALGSRLCLRQGPAPFALHFSSLDPRQCLHDVMTHTAAQRL